MRELLPDSWYAKDGCIYIANPDGTHEVIRTCWEAERRAREAETKRAQVEALQKHLEEKRALPKERNPMRGR